MQSGSRIQKTWWKQTPHPPCPASPLVDLQICKTNDAFSSARLTRPGRKSELAACFPLALVIGPFRVSYIGPPVVVVAIRPAWIQIMCGACSAGLLQLFNNPAISRFFQFLVSTSVRLLERETGFQRDFFFSLLSTRTSKSAASFRILVHSTLLSHPSWAAFEALAATFLPKMAKPGPLNQGSLWLSSQNGCFRMIDRGKLCARLSS